MATTPPHPSSAADAGDPVSAEAARLQLLLKRCSPETVHAACEFQRTGDRSHLPHIVAGVLARYVEGERRPKLREPSGSLRLVEDLGLDSLSLMEAVVMMEDVLNISVTNEEMMGLRTLGDVEAFVTQRVR